MTRHHVQHDGFERPASFQHVIHISATGWHLDDIFKFVNILMDRDLNPVEVRSIELRLSSNLNN